MSSELRPADDCSACRAAADAYLRQLRLGSAPSDQEMRDLRARMVSHALSCRPCREVLDGTVEAALAASFMSRRPEWYTQAAAIVAGASEPARRPDVRASLASVLLKAIDAAGRPIDAAEEAFARWAAGAAEWIADRVSTDSLVVAQAITHCSGASKEYRIGQGLPADWWCETIVRFAKHNDQTHVTLKVLPDRKRKTQRLRLIIVIEGESTPALVHLRAFDDATTQTSLYVGDAEVPLEALGDEQRVAVILVLPRQAAGE